MFAAIKFIRYAHQNKLFFIPIRPKVFSLGFERKATSRITRYFRWYTSLSSILIDLLFSNKLFTVRAFDPLSRTI